MTTATGGAGAPLPTATAPALTAVDETVRSADRLGLTWKLRPGSVQLPPTSDPTTVPVLLDGDTAAVDTYSLVGDLTPGSRVMTMHVPPSGVYVTGFAGPAPAGSVVVGARATKTSGLGVIVTTAAGAEADIPELALSNASLIAGNLYSFMGNISINGGGGSSSFQFKWRKGTALTGTIVAGFIYLPLGSGFDDTKAFDASYLPSVSDTDTYYLSVQRAAGVANINIYGTPGSLAQSHARLVHIGSYTPGASLFTDRV